MVEKKEINTWKRFSKMQRRSNRIRKGMNLSRLSKLTKPNQVVLVADKILGEGKMTHPVQIAALKFSKTAKEGITAAGGNIIAIDELKKKNPEGKDLVVLI